jgi:two-component system CheB/CheR fusion protein
VRRESITFRAKDGPRTLTIQVQPIQGPTSRDRYYAVLLQESTDPGTVKEKPRGSSLRSRHKQADLELEVERLTRALETSREYQQSNIEKIETANEELRSSHEEVLSANEELQSSNEELETSKEELQSANEELKTLNDELQQRNEELGQSNSDLTNVLASVQIPIAIIDSRLRLRRVTPAGEKLLNVIPTDVNRRITDFKPNLNVENLETFITQAIDKLASVEQDVQDREGHWYSLRVRPYRSVDNNIEGAILTIVDIDAVKRLALEHERARAFSEMVIDSVPYAILVLDGFFRVERANEAFLSLFHRTRAWRASGWNMTSLVWGERRSTSTLGSSSSGILTNP